MQEYNFEQINRELYRFNSFYYRNRFRLLAAILPIILAINILLILINAYLYLSSPHEPKKFFASNMYNGVVTPLTPMSQPTVNQQQILSFVSLTISNFFTFNSDNYRDTLNSFKQYFTANGWNGFYTFWQSSAELNNIITKQLAVSGAIDGTPLLLSDGAINGHYAWNISVPIIATFTTKDNSQQYQRRLNVTLTVVRIPNIDNPEAIAIDSFQVVQKQP
jgi:intracellular multiplication protein IcmL